MKIHHHRASFILMRRGFRERDSLKKRSCSAFARCAGLRVVLSTNFDFVRRDACVDATDPSRHSSQCGENGKRRLAQKVEQEVEQQGLR